MSLFKKFIQHIIILKPHQFSNLIICTYSILLKKTIKVSYKGKVYKKERRLKLFIFKNNTNLLFLFFIPTYMIINIKIMFINIKTLKIWLVTRRTSALPEG